MTHDATKPSESKRTVSGAPSPPRRRRWRRPVVAVLLMLAIPLIPFTVNGVFLADGETPIGGTLPPEPADSLLPGGEVKVMAWNIAKGFIHRGGLSFDDRHAVIRRLDRMAEVIKQEQPDLLFLCEAVRECGPTPIDQVRYLAKATGMHAWAFGENYSFGIPSYRVVGGNAILSRRPLKLVANPSLAGRKPFYITKNSRRVLWCEADFAGQTVLMASVHNDSFDLANNLKQVREQLAFMGERDALLAGDFNATPENEPMKALLASGRFAGHVGEPKTFPAEQPKRAIDFILAPRSWRLREHRVLPVTVSDHRPVVSVFALPASDGE